MQEELILVISSPRSGSTLLQRMLGSHSEIFAHPEPHLLTPLYYLGYYDTVERAPYDHINAAQALRELCQELPRGEDDYLDALRAYASTLYGRVLRPTGKRFFVDKTPAYALVLPFIEKLYPRAKFVVLTRHPLAIMHSVAHSFFAGDYAQAHATNPIVNRYVPAIGRLLRERPVDFVHVRYDDLVTQPEEEMRRVLDFVGAPFESGCVHYGQQKHISKSFGDPMSVEKHVQPVSDSLHKWTGDLGAHADVRALAERIIEELDPDDLAAWGYPKGSLWAPLGDAAAAPARTSRFNGYRLKRQVLLAMRQRVHGNVLETSVRKVRYLCDLLLRSA